MDMLEQGWCEESTGSAFGDLIGPHFAKDVDGVPRYGFIVTPKHLNRNFGLHGGMTASCLDMALARTIATSIKNPNIATLHLGIEFVDVAKVGEFVEVVVEIVRSTRSVVFCRGTMLTGERVVAVANGVWKIISAPRQESAHG